MPRYICWLCTPYPMYPRSPLGWLYWYRTQRGHASSSRPNPLGQFVRSGHPLAMWHNSGFERSSGESSIGLQSQSITSGGLNIPRGPFLMIIYHAILVHLPPVSQCLLILTREQPISATGTSKWLSMKFPGDIP